MASLNDILSAIQNGVVALNNLTKQMRGSFLNISGTLAGKANLVGGNTFTGGQIALSFVSDANPTSAIGVLDRGGSGNISLMYRSGVTTAFWNNTVGDVIRYDTSANVSMLGDLTFVGSAWTTTTPTPTAQTGAFTTVSATVKQKISGKTCTVQVTVIVTAVGTAAGQILVPLPTAASYAVAGAAVDLSNGGINMTCVVNGAQMQIVPTAGVISNDVYLGFATYEIA